MGRLRDPDRRDFSRKTARAWTRNRRLGLVGEEASPRARDFIGGKPEKVAETKARFPNAIFCSIGELNQVIEDSVAGRLNMAPTPDRIRTAETAKQTSATPLAKKLGIVDEVKYAVVNRPKGFLNTLAAPNGAIHEKKASSVCDVIVLFARDAASLAARLTEYRPKVGPTASLWLAWPKKTSALASDLSDEVVRQMGLRSGLVDVKVCAIDEDWSALKFMVRIADRPAERTKKTKK